MSIVFSIFRVFTINTFFFSFYVVAYVCTLSDPTRGLKRSYYLPEDRHIVLRIVLKVQGEVHMDEYFLIYILTISCGYLLYKFFSRGIRMHIPDLAMI